MTDQNEITPGNPKTVFDAHTGETFVLVAERWFDVAAAWFSILYSIGMIVLLGYLLIDTWTGNYHWMTWFGFKDKPANPPLDLIAYRLIVYTAIGGGIGAAVDNIRSFIHWHAELRSFGWRFVWKYIALPPLGATLAVMVYAIIRGGIAVFNGSAIPNGGALAAFTAWATGTLAGYGSHQVFIWLDDKVSSLFKVDKSAPPANVDVPDLKGKTRDEAEQALKDSKLTLGKVSEAKSAADQVGKVINQSPAAATKAAPDSKVDLTIGVASAQTSDVVVPDLAGKTRDESAQILKAGQLALGDVSENGTSDAQQVGKVLSQTPAAGQKAASGSKVTVVIGKAP